MGSGAVHYGLIAMSAQGKATAVEGLAEAPV